MNYEETFEEKLARIKTNPTMEEVQAQKDMLKKYTGKDNIQDLSLKERLKLTSILGKQVSKFKHITEEKRRYYEFASLAADILLDDDDEQ